MLFPAEMELLAGNVMQIIFYSKILPDILSSIASIAGIIFLLNDYTKNWPWGLHWLLLQEVQPFGKLGDRGGHLVTLCFYLLRI